MNATSALSLFPETKLQVKTFVEKVKAEVLSGEKDPLEFAILFKSLEEVVKELRADGEIRECILDEAVKFGQKTFETRGAKLTIRESAQYDYSEDSKWCDLKSELDNIKARMKVREDMLKSLTGPVADPDTGEIINPAAKKSTTTVSVSLL